MLKNSFLVNGTNNGPRGLIMGLMGCASWEVISVIITSSPPRQGTCFSFGDNQRILCPAINSKSTAERTGIISFKFCILFRNRFLQVNQKHFQERRI